MRCRARSGAGTGADILAPLASIPVLSISKMDNPRRTDPGGPQANTHGDRGLA